MKKVAVFGKPGSGKSTLCKALASATGMPLYQLDSIEYNKDGERVGRPVFDEAHERILSSESWIIDGLGPLNAFNQRLEAADTLIYVDLPYRASYWFVIKRLLKGLFVKPEGWPEGSSVLKGTLECFKVLRLCPKFWNDDFISNLEALSSNKSVYRVQSISELNSFVYRNIK